EQRASRLGVVCLIAVLFSLAPHSPVYGAIIAVTPLRLIRYPSKAMLLAALAVAMLAGLGLDALQVRRRDGVVPFAFLLALCASARVLVSHVEWWGPRLLQPEA